MILPKCVHVPAGFDKFPVQIQVGREIFFNRRYLPEGFFQLRNRREGAARFHGGIRPAVPGIEAEDRKKMGLLESPEEGEERRFGNAEAILTRNRAPG